MASYPSDQRCPRCQYPVAPGATTCANCGLALTGMQGAVPGSSPMYPQPNAGNPYGSDPYSNQPPTSYGGSAMNSAPTMQTPLYPQGSGGWAGSQPQQPDYPPPAPTYLAAYPGSQPQGNMGAPPTYPTNQAAYPGTAPAYPGSQPMGNFPNSFGTPSAPAFAPPSAPSMPPPTQQRGSGLKIAIIALVVLVVLGGGGAAAYLLTRPKPVMTVTSKYNTGSTPIAADGTTLHISGQKFSGSSTITFLVDGQPTPGGQTTQSDSNGNVTVDLNVTKDWATGAHTLTAKDASGYVTQAGSPVQIVSQGQAGTPGPNGSPTNSATFTLNITINSQVLGTVQETLTVTGKGDTGGAPCQTRDNGSTAVPENGSITFSDGNQLPYTESSTDQCSGTYTAGHLNYVETTVTDEWDFSGSSGTLRCPISPHKKQVLTGDFSGPNTISGTFSGDGFRLQNCTYKGNPVDVTGDTGTFTGTISQ